MCHVVCQTKLGRWPKCRFMNILLGKLEFNMRKQHDDPLMLLPTSVTPFHINRRDHDATKTKPVIWK